MAQVTGDGWLRVPYDGPDLAVIEMQAGTGWQDAYLDWDAAGARVAQIRWSGPAPASVSLRVNGVTVTPPGAAAQAAGPQWAG